MKKLQLFVDYKHHRSYAKRQSVLVISTLLLLTFGPIWAFVFDDNSKLLLLPSFVFILLYNFFYASQFACAALSVRERFKMVNKYLKFEYFYKFTVYKITSFILEFRSNTKVEPGNFFSLNTAASS